MTHQADEKAEDSTPWKGAGKAVEEETYDLSLLKSSKLKWAASPGLRLVYSDLFSELGTLRIAGDCLEVGSGIGAMKETLPDLVTSDLDLTSYVDRAISCYEISKSNRQWANILAVDVLHHLRFPMRFFESAAGALSPGGRLILNEPAATPAASLFYGVCHHEPCLPRKLKPPFELPADDDEGSFANMGMGVGLFVDHRDWVTQDLDRIGLRLVRLQFRDVLAYPASGGFSKPQFLPTSILRLLLRGEKWLPQWVMKYAALRMTIVLEKFHEPPAKTL